MLFISILVMYACTCTCINAVHNPVPHPSGMQQIAFCEGERAQVQSVLLLTDGLANAGITTTEGILQEMKKIQNPPATTDDVPKKVSV